MKAQQQLERFYETLRTEVPDRHEQFSWLLGPDLIHLDTQYLNSKPRIAIVGQEMRDWYYSYPEFIAGEWECFYPPAKKAVVQRAISEYQGFNFACGEKEPRKRTPFWRFFHEVREKAFPNEPEACKKILWTNLIKFVHRKHISLLELPFSDAESAIQLQEHMLTTELRIAAPDFCLFITRPNFDCLLNRYFRGLKFEPLPARKGQRNLDKRKFAQLVHKALPARTYRTYHPGYLNRNKKLWRHVIKIVIEQIAD